MRRKLYTWIRERYKLSERRACGLAGLCRCSARYQSRKDPQTALRMRLKELASIRVSFGFERLTILLRREGWAVNRKRVHRLYKEEGLQVRTKQRKKIARRRPVVVEFPTGPNQRWSMDFVHDRLEDGRRFRRDRSSQPHRLSRSHELGLVVEAVGRKRRGQAAVRIASELGVPRSTVGFWLRKAGTSQPASLREKEPPNRYEHEAPGDLLHLDTKKLANFSEVGHRLCPVKWCRKPGVAGSVRLSKYGC